MIRIACKIYALTIESLHHRWCDNKDSLAADYILGQKISKLSPQRDSDFITPKEYNLRS